MKKSFWYHFGIKLAAWILLAICIFAFFLSVACTVVLFNTGAYWDGGRNLREAASEQVFSFDKLRIRSILREYLSNKNIDDTEYREMYAKNQSNIFFVIYDKEGNVVVDYFSEDAYRISYEYEEFFKSSEKEINETKIFADFSEAEKYIKALEKENHISEYSYSEADCELEITYYSLDSITYTVNAFIRKDFSARDMYSYTLQGVDFIVGMRYWVILFAAVSAILCLVLLVFLCLSAGREPTGEIKLSLINRIPLDVFWGICATVSFLLLLALYELANGDEYEWFTVAVFIGVSTVCSVLVSASTVTLSARIKAKTWLKNTLIYGVSRLLIKFLCCVWRGIKFLAKNMPLFWQALLLFIALKAIEIACIIAGFDFYVMFWIFEGAVLLAALIYLVLSLRKLQVAAKEMARGNLEYRAELSAMPYALREHGENLNNIGEGLRAALSEKIKSEHMKAELITNVSHDIKTPLTSIVNYVDLLKKEGLESENATEYLSVLERQAGKLKKLTEDLIEASKATAGCIAVNAEEMDINVLLAQACGEYEGKLLESKLTPVLTLSEENPLVYADGGLVWRVFDNLFNNICKYSQKGTRVYLKTETKDGKVYITFSNISAAQLDISSDELMERFVRGDSSRNTEGSGLGLSIARSLTELQNGSFDIKIDGDLFKVEIVFDVMKV
jgi:signal transduction histidine kinase